MNYKFFPLFFVVLLTSFTSLPNKTNSTKINVKTETNSVSRITSIYNELDANSFALPNFECFSLAMNGFQKLKERGLVEKNILTLVDFSLSSNTKRLWVIDLATNTVLFQSLVAHGRNTGEEYASAFSNNNSSFKSSLGFYATGEIYQGKHGASLRLDGLERGYNNNARERGVVVHGADYVSESFIRNHKRLGRSQGCPALPVELTGKIIQIIKDKSCLYIYHPSRGFAMEEKLIS